jgi:hypothetical protein
VSNELHFGFRSATLKVHETFRLCLDKSSVPESSSQLAGGIELKHGVRPDENAGVATATKSDDPRIRLPWQSQLNAPD